MLSQLLAPYFLYLKHTFAHFAHVVIFSQLLAHLLTLLLALATFDCFRTLLHPFPHIRISMTFAQIQLMKSLAGKANQKDNSAAVMKPVLLIM